MLLSVLENSWKISDFGLTSEGTSRFAYTTQFARGTVSYRAPELVKNESIVSQTSDVWALGCIFYELIFKTKAFPSDFHVFDYIHSKGLPKIHPLPVDTRVRTYIRELTYHMMEINWWQRPSSRDVLEALNSISDGTSPVLTAFTSQMKPLEHSASQSLDPAGSSKPESHEEIAWSRERMNLLGDDERWENTRWYLCW